MQRFWKMIKANPFLLLTLLLWNIKLFLLHCCGIKTIVYNLHHDYFYDIFESVQNELKKQTKIRFYYSYLHSDPELKNYLLQKCDRRQLISNLVSPFLAFDLFICAEITGPDFPLAFLRTRTIQIYHGTGVYNLYEKIDVLNRFDSHFAVGPQYLPFLETAYKKTKKQPQIFRIGYPKLDILLQEYPFTERLCSLYDLQEKPVVLYAPHWNEFSSLHALGEELLVSLAQLPVNLLVKPHNYLFVQYAQDNWQQRLQNLTQKYENLKLVSRPNTQELYPLADLMITDTGTTAALEFSLLQKPLLIFCREDWFEQNKQAEVERNICETAICFKTIKQLTNYVEKVTHNDPAFQAEIEEQKQKQAKLIENYLYNPGTATHKAAAQILTCLNLPQRS